MCNDNVPIKWTILKTIPQSDEDDEDFDPQLHFTGTVVDTTEVDCIASLLLKYRTSISKWYLCTPMPGMFSLELEMSDEDQMRLCQKEYDKSHRS